MGRDGGISEHGDPGKPRHELLQHLQSLRLDRFIEIAQPGHVSAGPRQTGHQSKPNGISRDHDDGNGAGGFLGRQRTRAAGRHQNIHFETDKLGNQLGYPLHAPVGRADFEGDRLPIDVAEFTEALPECRDHAFGHGPPPPAM